MMSGVAASGLAKGALVAKANPTPLHLKSNGDSVWTVPDIALPGNAIHAGIACRQLARASAGRVRRHRAS